MTTSLRLRLAGLAAACAFLVAAPVAQAQMFYSPVRVGIKGGATYATVTSEGTVDSPNYTWGAVGGLVLSAKFNESLGIQPELLWHRKGYEFDYEVGGGNVLPGSGSIETRLDYIQLPVLVTANAGRFQFQLGPYASYLINASVKNDAENNDYNFVEDLDANNFNRWDFGLTGGVAFDFEPIQIGLRADWGLSNIGNTDEGNQNLRVAQDNQNISFSLFASFMFGN